MNTNRHVADLSRYATLFETVSPDALDRLSEWFTEDARFQDPFNDVRGVAAIRRVFARMFETCHDIRFAVTDRLVHQDVGCLRWSMSFRPNVRGLQQRTWHIEGMSRIVFAADGRVQEHVDFWDSGTYFYARLPLLGSVIRAIRKRAG